MQVLSPRAEGSVGGSQIFAPFIERAKFLEVVNKYALIRADRGETYPRKSFDMGRS